MKLLIVEDEELAVEKLQLMVQALVPEAEVVGATGSISKTVEWLAQHGQPDVILMDIELSDGHSFEIFNQVTVEAPVIFTTSYDEYALKAFKVNSIDYLLKPIQKEELKRAFEKLRKQQAGKNTDHISSFNIQRLVEELQLQFNAKAFRKRFLVKQGLKHLPVEVEEIAYFYVYDRAILFRTHDNRKYVLDYTMEELEQLLDPAVFFRINRSFIASIKSVTALHDYFNSRLLLDVQPAFEDKIVVSREKVAEFKKWVGK
jgi:DNA-binding LytR/AlgR family response regulator